MDELIKLLIETRDQLMDMWKVADDSVADYTLNIETAVNFITKALRTQDRLDVFKALQKAHDVLEKEYDETPKDEEYDNLVDRISNVLNGLPENKNFIKEFGDSQAEKNIQVKYEPRYAMKKPKKFDIKEFATNTVLKFMNEPKENEVCELLYEHKKEISEKVKLYENHPGFMGMSCWDNKEKNECSLGARIDPTNTKNWVRTKEEIFYRLPYAYKDSLGKFLAEIRKPHD